MDIGGIYFWQNRSDTPINVLAVRSNLVNWIAHYLSDTSNLLKVLAKKVSCCWITISQSLMGATISSDRSLTVVEK